MGADLYIQSLYKANEERFKPKFEEWVKIRDTATDKRIQDEAQQIVSHYYERMHSEGYFRDSYNGTNTLNRLGLSWWRDVTKLTNKKGEMSIKNIKKFLALIDPIPVQNVTKAELIEMHCAVDAEDTVESWNKMSQDGKVELVAFLKKAIELNEPIECSL